jgi:GNAT superfamily N-acetyltransferase
VKIRRATLRDLDLLVRHRREMFLDMGHTDADELRQADAAYRRWARARMRSGELVAFVAEEKGEPMASGSVWMKPVQPRPGYVGGVEPYLLGMHTDAAHRGKGAASRIVRAAISFVRKAGYPRMSLHATGMGRPIYARAGFVETNEMKLDLNRRSSRASTTRRGSRACSRTARCTRASSRRA